MKKPKILIFDIETSPTLGYTWGLYEQNVLKTVKSWEILSVAYKWADEKKVYVVSRRTHTEKQIMQRMHKLFNESTHLLGHNGDNFDIKKVRTKLLMYGLTPPEPSKSIDTLKILRKYFKFYSNKLDNVCQELGLGGKVQTGGFGLWERCMAGNAKALKQMEKYNKQDVILLEKLYLKIRGWIFRQPGISLAENRECPNCASSHVKKQGFKLTKINGRVQQFQCLDCYGWFLAKKA
jgi:uncharacterized protein YprB with RNaseH-like and TPR domain